MISARDGVRQAAFLLHSRPYRETSALADYFTEQSGRVRCVVRGVRRPRSRHRPLLRPFVPLEIQLTGRGELKNLRDGESAGPDLALAGRSLWCGLYLNELLTRLLPAEEPLPRLFALYHWALGALVEPELEEPVLRSFERRLLEELGYGITLDHDYRGEALDPDRHYVYREGEGLVPSAPAPDTLSGAACIAIAADDYRAAEVRRAAKRLMRQALAPLLGDRPLNSRQLFRPLRPEGGQ